MSQLAGFTATGEDSHLVCRLKKSLYGLKQAPRMWYQKFDSYIRQLGYNRSDSDPCMYVRQLADESRIYLILYVDDMLIAGSNQAEIGKLKRSLHAKFAMKELGQARHILGMRIERNRTTKTLRLSQSDYIRKVLKRFNMENAKPAPTPLPTSIRLSDRDSPATDKERELNGKIPYASAVGSIMYAMVATRPDLAYVVGVVSRYMSNLGKKHWEAVKHILRYLKLTTDAQLTFRLITLDEVKGYTDSDYARNADNRKSTSGYIFTYGGGAISWRLKLQECTALSTTEAEYIAASEAVKEAIWLHRLSADFSATSRIDRTTTTIYCESQSAVHLINNLVYRIKTKHIEMRYHHIHSWSRTKSLKSRKWIPR